MESSSRPLRTGRSCSFSTRSTPSAVESRSKGTARILAAVAAKYNSLVTQLMQSIDQYRQMDGLLIVAATNYLDGLEPTLIRDGRFDARIRLDLPSESERAEILTAQLRKFRWKNHDLTAIAKRTPGWSPRD